MPLGEIPDTVRFTLFGEDKVSCSKKCKKVTKFAFMLRRTSEAEVLRAFENMLRKKSGKKMSMGGPALHKQTTLNYGVGSIGTHRAVDHHGLGANNWTVSES